MPILLKGRVMSVDLKDAQAETKDRRAKESEVEIEVYVARKRTEIVKAPAHMLTNLRQLVEEVYVFECASYSEWSMGNKTGISFTLSSVLDEDFEPVDLDSLRETSRPAPSASRPGVVAGLSNGSQRSAVPA